jgi:hypothetical protein
MGRGLVFCASLTLVDLITQAWRLGKRGQAAVALLEFAHRRITEFVGLIPVGKNSRIIPVDALLSGATDWIRKKCIWVMVSEPIALDEGRAYVIGDIHGRSDLLDRMVDLISRDLDAFNNIEAVSTDSTFVMRWDVFAKTQWK